MQANRVFAGRWQSTDFVANHPALDFLNTVSGRFASSVVGDRLASFQDVVTWAISAGLVDAGHFEAALEWELSPPDVCIQVRNARALREAGHAVLSAVASGQPAPPGPVAHIMYVSARGLETGACREASACQPRRLEQTCACPAALQGIIAWQLLDAYFRLDAGRIHSCPTCGWMYFDLTRGGRRRWCRMETCGNREKARRHRQKRMTSARPIQRARLGR